ncbi:Glycoprotein 3-alpha-L-fucosyltransferase A [Echinococcus granulosus]|uniref:Fucosyltransferase n=1 Tax=Echinococcus granulosus TaxID=6210 RepID=W6U4R7_ECHGR|nr:Glycoprotein 3-alpha-L-fucosyltransferase A [Echinococcus granulosus]EUB56138.1 Glycoprotein 3-alpha-L-fucosyltransferase A [Echinococcus granulosus]
MATISRPWYIVREKRSSTFDCFGIFCTNHTCFGCLMPTKRRKAPLKDSSLHKRLVFASQVDIYGRGNLELVENAHPFQWLSKRYKFYLAFENSNCRNYITEKAFINALRVAFNDEERIGLYGTLY